MRNWYLWNLIHKNAFQNQEKVRENIHDTSANENSN